MTRGWSDTPERGSAEETLSVIEGVGIGLDVVLNDSLVEIADDVGVHNVVCISLTVRVTLLVSASTRPSGAVAVAKT